MEGTLLMQRVRGMAKHYHPFGTYHFIVGSQIRTPPHQKPPSIAQPSAGSQGTVNSMMHLYLFTGLKSRLELYDMQTPPHYVGAPAGVEACQERTVGGVRITEVGEMPHI